MLNIESKTLNKTKDLCHKGHLLQGDNVYLRVLNTGRVTRTCVICKTSQDKTYETTKRVRGKNDTESINHVDIKSVDLSKFASKIEKVDSGCWLWSGPFYRGGYGCLNYKGRNFQAHRAFYEVIVGPIPDGLHLDHLCRIHNCVNPAHLEPVTNKENILRGTGFAARNARKTHCPKGHPYDAENTSYKTFKSGTLGRVCKTCLVSK